MRKVAVISVVLGSLTACGGESGGRDGSPPTSVSTTSTDTVSLTGQVIDGPVAGARVCLFSDGVQVRDAAGAAVCSTASDAQGNYSLTVSRNIPTGFLTLVASTSSYIKLASALGTVSEVLGAADNSGAITSTKLSSTRITNFTTANFALADTNRDGTVSKAELDAYNANYIKIRPVAALVKAAIDLGQSGSLIAGQTSDTLQLALAAANNQILGATNKTAAQWAADPGNAAAMAAVDQDLAVGVASGFSSYQLSTAVTSYQIPARVTANNGAASIGCEVNTNNETATVQIALDGARGAVILKHDNVQTIGTYDPRSGAMSLSENDPLAVSSVSPSGVTYYAEGYFKLNGSFDASTGKFTGTYSELSANTWSLDATRQVCTAGGTATAIKL